MPPDLAQSWWMDAPSVAPPQATLPSEAPAAPPPADAWWLTTNAPSPAAENAITDSSPPSVPPPLPETIVSSPAAEAPPDLLVFEPFTKMPAVGQPSFHDHAPARNNALARFFTPLHIGLLVGAVLVSLLALTVLILLLRGSEPAPKRSTEKPAGKEEKKDKSAASRSSPSQPRRERTEDELRREVAAFQEVSLIHGNNGTDALRAWESATAAAQSGQASQRRTIVAAAASGPRRTADPRGKGMHARTRDSQAATGRRFGPACAVVRGKPGRRQSARCPQVGPGSDGPR